MIRLSSPTPVNPGLGARIGVGTRLAACLALVLALVVAVPVAGQEDKGDPTVRAIQTKLQELGYEITVIDGLYGPETRKAIEAFQKDQELPVTGKATPKLRERLEHLMFRRSGEAERLWAQSRLYLKALGYAPGDGGLDSPQAREALSQFASNYWLETDRGFSRTLHDLIARRVAETPAAHRFLCRHHVEDGAYSLAIGWCRRAAERGHREAQFYMGWMAYYGRGRPTSKAAAFDWYLRAAEAGHTEAQVYTGLMYRKGEGTKRDADAAMRWYRAATGGEVRPDPPAPPLPQ